MAIPDSPPAFHDLLSAYQGELSRILDSVSGPTAAGKYRHWDTVRHMRPPEGLNHRQWWLGLKLYRRPAMKSLPFQDKHGKPLWYALVDPIPEKLHAIDLAGGGTVELEADVLNSEQRDRFLISSLMEEAITSSQLEGAATTSQVARDMLSNERAPRDRDEQMIFNNFATMRRIGELKRELLTPDHVFEIHRCITRDTLDNPDAAGRFRTANDGPVVVHDRLTGEIHHHPPNPETLKDRLQLLCNFANAPAGQEFVHPVIRAIAVHFMLAYDHPFVDGNGRTARALFYWTMLHHGYWLFEFLSISTILRKSQGRYASAFLYTETDENDLTYFILHQLNAIDRAMGELREFIARKTRQQRSIEQQLRGQIALNHRQTALLSHAVRHPLHRYTIASHQTRHAVAYQTARTDLFGLAERGLLNASKSGKTYYFTPVANLEQALDQLGAGGKL